jgi:hypothetical protein
MNAVWMEFVISFSTVSANVASCFQSSLPQQVTGEAMIKQARQ